MFIVDTEEVSDLAQLSLPRLLHCPAPLETLHVAVPLGMRHTTPAALDVL